jgi:hypothetical protein
MPGKTSGIVRILETVPEKRRVAYDQIISGVVGGTNS